MRSRRRAGFWLRQDLPAVLDVWATVVPHECIHVVTVPPPGADPIELLRRFGRAAGFDATSLPADVTWDNTSMGAVGTEVLRRANVHLHRRLNQRQYHDVVETALAPILAGAAGAARLRLPDTDVGWVRREADRVVAAVREAAYSVEGDLDDLVPRTDLAGREPGEASEPELLEVAVAALAGLTERFALAKWSRRRPDTGVDRTPASMRRSRRGRPAPPAHGLFASSAGASTRPTATRWPSALWAPSCVPVAPCGPAGCGLPRGSIVS